MTKTITQSTTLKKRHQNFSTPEKIIFQLVEKYTGTEALSKKKIVKGYDSEVYEVKTEEDKSFIVRIKHFGEISYVQECWAREQCRETQVPLPWIYYVGKIQLGTDSHEIMIMDKLTGQPFYEVRKKLNEKQINTVLREAGKVLRKIHSVAVGGFYQRDDKGNWDFPSWEKLAHSSYEDRAAERSLIEKSGFSRKQTSQMLNLLKKYRDDFSCDKPVLCHGDYLPEHIFVDKNLKVTGIIDFGMFQGNHPIHDFSYFYFEVPSLNLKPLTEGYGNHPMFRDRFKERLLIHSLGLQMGHLAYHINESMVSESKFVVKRLKKTLREIEKL